MSPREDEARAQRRYIVMNLARISGLAMVILGLAITQELISLPWALGALLAVAGLLDFFFAPPLLAKRWKARDDHQE